MIQISIRDNTPELMQKLQKAASRFVRKGAFYIEGEMKAAMAEPKSGPTYDRGPKAIEKGKKATHHASAPGESPAIDSSNYVNTIDVPEIMANSLEAVIGTSIEYALPLEDGTDHMEARPLWEKEAREALPTLEAILAAEIRRR